MHSIQCWEGNARLQQRQPLMSASTFVLLIPPSTVSLSCRCVSTTVWCSDSSDTQECWRPSASDSRDTASNTRSRYFLFFSSCLLSNCLWTLWPVGTWETFPDLICNVSGLCASLPCAAASRHEPNQVCYQGLLQKSAPATCWISSGQHHGVCVCVCSPGLDQCWSLGLGVEKCSCLLKVFLREAERQRLQTLLHQEVLRRIVTLQRRFRAMLERKHFVNMRRSASTIQVGCFDWRTERLGLRRCYYGSCVSWWL